MAALPKGRFSEQEYLALEREGQHKHEYHAGDIVAMVGASEPHNLIVISTIASLYQQLRGRPCKLYAGDMRVRISQPRRYTYPDITVVCGQRQFADEAFDTLLNPMLIIEVLSPSTEAYDRGRKFQYYRTLDSLREYVLIAQESYHIDHYARQTDGGWRLSEADGLAARIALPAIGCALSLADVYEQLEAPG